ncbi:hypothetical protein [Massilia putida]|nr:hypothetical protein [Massilia putida]
MLTSKPVTDPSPSTMRVGAGFGREVELSRAVPHAMKKAPAPEVHGALFV